MADPVTNTESILYSMKLMLGMEPEYNAFDTDIIIHINTILSKLVQVEVGPQDGFELNAEDPGSSKWEDFLGDKKQLLNMAKTYMYLQLRVLFDPPQNSSTLETMKKEAEELLWRLNVEADTWPKNHENVEED